MNRSILTVLFLFLTAACSSQPAPGGAKPVINSFSADPAIIAPGETSTLSWQVTGATRLRLEPGVGEVEGSSRTVQPAQTTQYTLIASNANGETTDTTTVTVTGSGGDDAEPLHNTIAYALGNGDEIRLVNPDGTNDRRLWAHGQADPSEVYDVWSMSWSPDATQLAFASTHERGCSLFLADIYAIDADGTDYRRVTQAPACAELASYPKGTVRVPVRNDSFASFSGFLYFQGAPGVQPVNLAPGGSAVVTFENVADFGEDALQVATVIAPNDAFNLPDTRYILGNTATDVRSGGTVTTAEARVFAADFTWEARSPTWRADGTSLGFALNFNALLELPPEPRPLEFGESLLAEDAQMPFLVIFAARGPTAATANQLLHTGWGPGEPMSIYLTAEGAAAVGEPLVSFASFESVFGLTWLPNGSGFVFSVSEGLYTGEARSNLFVYTFASGEATRVTSFTGEFAGQVAVSPDGQRFAFERAASFNTATGGLEDRDLWLVNRDGSGLSLLVEDAYAPAWSH